MFLSADAARLALVQHIMFYLMPASEQDILRELVFERLDVPGRDITEHELI
ncbi:hypothetical protein [Pseudomonas sp. TWI929]|uniref:hypothetical protein n=1 Tax=Pseudomonas sp. TWI929 TaxID=3136795 RepID=UPI0032096915